jgi:hypothetical protein
MVGLQHPQIYFDGMEFQMPNPRIERQARHHVSEYMKMEKKEEHAQHYSAATGATRRRSCCSSTGAARHGSKGKW